MKYTLPLTLLALLAPSALQSAAAAELQPWPPKLVFGDDTLSATGNFAYDFNRVNGDSSRIEDADGWRRREFGLTLARKGVYDIVASFDFEADTWMDAWLRVESEPLTGRDIGRFRLGQSKLPLGFEGNTGSRNSLFVETALPSQAFYPGRRIGVDWAIERPTHLINAGYYRGDLQGDNPGTVLVARGAWTPFKAPGDVLHLGLAATREHPDGETNGLGVAIPPGARWRARPEAGLTDTRLVDSGPLVDVDRVERVGLEAVWIHGPWSLQAEQMAQTTTRSAAPDYSADGGYVAGSWMVTGESRGYSGGNVSNPVPAGRAGALEFTARRSWLDLDDAGIEGGRQRNWTLGANWYFDRHVKLQANYVRADVRRAGARIRENMLMLRTQVHF